MPEFSPERRYTPRFGILMDGRTTDLHTKAVARVRCSDIGLTGCYLDTLNPLERGTPLLVHLEHGGRGFEAQAKVTYMVKNMGMGVEFVMPIAEEQLAVLRDWIAALPANAPPLSGAGTGD
jgi:hypothetical protein